MQIEQFYFANKTVHFLILDIFFSRNDQGRQIKYDYAKKSIFDFFANRTL